MTLAHNRYERTARLATALSHLNGWCWGFAIGSAMTVYLQATSAGAANTSLLNDPETVPMLGIGILSFATGRLAVAGLHSSQRSMAAVGKVLDQEFTSLIRTDNSLSSLLDRWPLEPIEDLE